MLTMTRPPCPYCGPTGTECILTSCTQTNGHTVESPVLTDGLGKAFLSQPDVLSFMASFSEDVPCMPDNRSGYDSQASRLLGAQSGHNSQRSHLINAQACDNLERTELSTNSQSYMDSGAPNSQGTSLSVPHKQAGSDFTGVPCPTRISDTKWGPETTWESAQCATVAKAESPVAPWKKSSTVNLFAESPLPFPPESHGVNATARTSAAPATESSAHGKTGISIHEIIHHPKESHTIRGVVHNAPVLSVASKRKADALSEETLEEPKLSDPEFLRRIQSQLDALPAKKIEMGTQVPSTCCGGCARCNVKEPTEKPNKRIKLQLAASSLAGAIVGGIGVVAALISLPEISQ
jgi:hypothetical protein